MTVQQTPQADDFKRKLRDVLQNETLNGCALNIPRDTDRLRSGD